MMQRISWRCRVLVAFSRKAVHCISSRKKVFPQTFLTELSLVLSRSKDLSFCKYVKIIFLVLKIITVRNAKIWVLQGQNIAQIEKLAAQRPPNATTKCYDSYIKWSFKGKKCTLLLIYFILRYPENLPITTCYVTFWKPAKIACLCCHLFPKSRPGHSKLQLNSTKPSLGSIDM